MPSRRPRGDPTKLQAGEILDDSRWLLIGPLETGTLSSSIVRTRRRIATVGHIANEQQHDTHCNDALAELTRQAQDHDLGTDLASPTRPSPSPVRCLHSAVRARAGRVRRSRSRPHGRAPTRCAGCEARSRVQVGPARTRRLPDGRDGTRGSRRRASRGGRTTLAIARRSTVVRAATAGAVAPCSRSCTNPSTSANASTPAAPSRASTMASSMPISPSERGAPSTSVEPVSPSREAPRWSGIATHTCTAGSFDALAASG